MPNPQPQQPTWLEERDYSYLSQLDVKGWYAEITRLYKLSVDQNLGLHRNDPRIIVISKASGTVIGHIGGPTAKFVVNVNMPDAFIHTQFEMWLDEVRKQVKSHVAKPGQHALNSKFDESKFKMWRKVGVVEYVDLLAWRTSLDPLQKKNYQKITLGRWIGRCSSKDVNTTERVTRSALASLPALGAQVEHELILDQPSRKLIAARIAKDLARPSIPVFRRIKGNN